MGYHRARIWPSSSGCAGVSESPPYTPELLPGHFHPPGPTLPTGGDLPFIFGFGSASVIWFLSLSTIVSLLGSKFNEKMLNIINKVCGGVIIFYGCKLIWNFVQLMGWVK